MADKEKKIKNNVSVYLKIDAKEYDEKFAPYLNSVLDGYLEKAGKYSFVMRTKDGEIIYVIPSKAGMPNEGDQVSIIVGNEIEITRKNLEKITKEGKK